MSCSSRTVDARKAICTATVLSLTSCLTGLISERYRDRESEEWHTTINEKTNTSLLVFKFNLYALATYICIYTYIAYVGFPRN